MKRYFFIISLPIITMLPAMADDAPAKRQEELVWSQSLEDLHIPDAPVHGRMTGCPNFVPDSVEFSYGALTFQTARIDSQHYPTPDQDWGTVVLTLPHDLDTLEKMEGKSLKWAPVKGKNVGVSAGARVTWVANKGSRTGNESFFGNYALILGVGMVTNGALPAKIYLCLPDEIKTVLAGTFEIKGREGAPLLLTKIHGNVEMPPAVNEKALFIGRISLNDKGTSVAEGVNIRLTKDGALPPGSSTISSGYSMILSNTKGLSYSFERGIPGWHLIVLSGAEVTTSPPMKGPEGFPPMRGHDIFESLPRIYSAHWVRLKDERSQEDCPLRLDPAALSSIKISVPGARDGTIVTFLPAPPAGLEKIEAFHGASSCLRVKITDEMSPVISLPEGSYEFRSLGRSKTVRIQRGKTMRVVLENDA